jgi:hypothetical protein
MRPGGLAHPQRYLDNAALDELLTPGVGDALRAGGDDDPVEGRAGGETLPAISHDHTCAVPACPKRSTRASCGLGIDVDGLNPSAFADQLREQCRVVAGAGSDLQHPHPRLEREPLEHLGHDRRLRRRTDRSSVSCELRRNRLVPIHRLKARPGGSLRDEQLPRHPQERRTHSLAPNHAPPLELTHELPPKRRRAPLSHHPSQTTS